MLTFGSHTKSIRFRAVWTNYSFQEFKLECFFFSFLFDRQCYWLGGERMVDPVGERYARRRKGLINGAFFRINVSYIKILERDSSTWYILWQGPRLTCSFHQQVGRGSWLVHSRQGILPHIRIHIWFWILWICKKLRSVYFPIPLWFNFTVNRFEIDCMPLHWSLFIYEFAISQKHFNSISQKAGWKLIEHHSDCTGFKRKCRQQISKNLFWWRKKFSLERPSC